MCDTMSDSARTYNELRNKVLNGAAKDLNEEHLKCLISTFKSVINSRRRCSYINDFSDLITVLEKRGYVGEANVESFGQIVNLLPNSGTLKDMISSYVCCMDRNRLQGSYISHGRHRSSEAVTSSNSLLPEAVVDHVCKSIGTDWKDLARNMSMREGDIDEIEEQYPRKLRERAYECMKRFVQDTDPYKLRQKLLYALDRCGRRDLKEEVEEILNRLPTCLSHSGAQRLNPLN